MGAMFDFTVTPDGGDPITVAAGMRDVVLWEKTHKGRALAQIGDATKLSASIIYELAYSACRRQRLLPDGTTEAAFCENYDIEFDVPEPEPDAADEQDSDMDPTSPGAWPGESSL